MSIHWGIKRYNNVHILRYQEVQQCPSIEVSRGATMYLHGGIKKVQQIIPLWWICLFLDRTLGQSLEHEDHSDQGAMTQSLYKPQSKTHFSICGVRFRFFGGNFEFCRSRQLEMSNLEPPLVHFKPVEVKWPRINVNQLSNLSRDLHYRIVLLNGSSLASISFIFSLC